MDQESLTNQVKTDGRLPINLISEDIELCYSVFEAFTRTNSEALLGKVESLVLPATSFCENRRILLANVTKFRKLKSFIYKGCARDGNRCIVKGSIENLPRNLTYWKKLTYLDLSFNEISEIPLWIYDLRYLCRLQLNFCNVRTIQHGIGNLICLRELHLRENLLTSLPREFLALQTLQVLNLSNNAFQSIPTALLGLPELEMLDLSYNNITGYLEAPGLRSLKILKLQGNKIDAVDVVFAELSCLECLDLCFNAIRNLPPDLLAKECILLDGNPIGCPSPEKLLQIADDSYNVPTYCMGLNACDMKFECGVGARYSLPCGIVITLPKDALQDNTTLRSELLRDSNFDFHLDDLDELLSEVLQLSPDGLSLDKPAKISIPYSFERNDQQIRETVIRVMSSDGSTEDLETTRGVESFRGEGYIAEAYVSHFSKFAVVARLLEASTIIKKDSSHLLFSPAFPQTKLKFEKGSVEDGTRVTLKVVAVDQFIVEEIARNPAAATSCILSVFVSPPETMFQKPVTVRIALPDKLLGKDFNRNDLKLMKCAHNAIEWEDVTSLTPVVISAVDVSFQVQSFSRFVLVTEIVCGVIRYIYRRLRTHKVQFLAVQKCSLPTQVLVQCVLEKKVAERFKQLKHSGYENDDAATEVQEMLEGSIYKTKIVGDLRLQQFKNKEARRTQQKNLVCRFFSQYPPNKKGFSRFFIERCEKDKMCHSGFVSFSRAEEKQKGTTITAKGLSPQRSKPSVSKRKLSNGDVMAPENEPITLESDRSDDDKSDDESHLGDVPISLQGDVLQKIFSDSKPPELNFGGLGTGMFREENLRLLGNQIGNEWREIGIFLGIPNAKLDQISSDFPGNLAEQIFRMLKYWSDLNRMDDKCIEEFVEGLSLAGRSDLAQKVKELNEEAQKEFHNSVKSLRFGP